MWSGASPEPLPLLWPGVWDTADDGAEHERCDEREEGQVDEALDTIIAEARQGLHVVLRPGEMGRHGERAWGALAQPTVAWQPDLRLG